VAYVVCLSSQRLRSWLPVVWHRRGVALPTIYLLLMHLAAWNEDKGALKIPLGGAGKIRPNTTLLFSAGKRSPPGV